MECWEHEDAELKALLKKDSCQTQPILVVGYFSSFKMFENNPKGRTLDATRVEDRCGTAVFTCKQLLLL